MANKSTTIYDCVVIGAGASGLFYSASRTSGNRKLLLEKTTRPGQKLLLSGNGMCNITHGGSIKDFIEHYGDNGRRIRSCLYKNNNLKLMKFVEGGGVPLVQRPDGKVFPKSMKSKDILNLLLAKTKENGFKLMLNTSVTDILPPESSDSPVKLILTGDRVIKASEVVIATGGASYPATGSDGTFMSILSSSLGVETVPLKPALAPVYVQNYPFTKLAGVSFDDVSLTSEGHTIRGPLLFTHKGFSGPAPLHISQYVKPGSILKINFIPHMTVPQAFTKLRSEQPGNSSGIAGYIARAFELPKSFAEQLFANPSRKFSGIGHKELETVAHLMTARSFSVSGTGGWNEAMATAGGVSLEEVNLKNMSLSRFPQIKVIGEALDVVGDTGGYNLQFAYSSAISTLSI